MKSCADLSGSRVPCPAAVCVCGGVMGAGIKSSFLS